MFVKNAELCFIDLFAGAGGLSEGFIQSGFNPIAHVEMNTMACRTLETRSCYYYLKNEGKLSIYYDYLRGKITRTEFLDHIPEKILKTIMCVEMSEHTIENIFNRIDKILDENGTKQILLKGCVLRMFLCGQDVHRRRNPTRCPSENFLYMQRVKALAWY